MGLGSSTFAAASPDGNLFAMSQETDLREHGVPEFSPFLSQWRLYIGCTVDALIEDQGELEWLEGWIEDINDILLEEDVEKRGVFFQIRCCLT